MKRNSFISVTLCFITYLIFFLFCADISANELPIFPGAEGFGATTTAGSGRNLFIPDATVYKVTNLNESGQGSLRECIEGDDMKGQEADPRICVFEVSGYIDITGFDLRIKKPFITIAGQTAPSPGVTVKGGPISVRTHDVLIQHIKVRVGDDLEAYTPTKRDGINIGSNFDEVYNIVIDHCSLSWAIDENIDTWAGAYDITLSNSIVSEGLSDSLHPKGRHSMGMLISFNSKNISVLNNLFASNNHRNPGAFMNTSTLIVNNLIYNADHSITYAENNLTSTNIGNVIISGPEGHIMQKSIDFYSDDNTGSFVYLSDNYSSLKEIPWCEGNYKCDDPWFMAYIDGIDPVKLSGNDEPPVWTSPLTVRPSSEVTDWVLARSGARPADRDTVDIRVVNDVVNRTGQIIDCVDSEPRDYSDCSKNAGGWPLLDENYRYLNLPPVPNSDDDGDGYTNLEEWLDDYALEVEGVVCTDSDGDGYSVEGGRCGTVDCDDSDETVFPGAEEICGDGIDNNCDEVTDEDVCIVIEYDIPVDIQAAVEVPVITGNVGAVTENNAVLIQDIVKEDNFDGGSSGWSTISGLWYVRNGEFSGYSNNSEMAVSTITASMTTQKLLIETDLISEPQEEKGGSGWFIVFDYQGPENFKYAGAAGDGKHWVVGHYDGVWHEMSRYFDVDASGRYWQHISVEIEGGIVRLFSDYELKAEAVYEQIGAGSFGIAAQHSVVHIDDFYYSDI